jgi:hypothetical protein
MINRPWRDPLVVTVALWMLVVMLTLPLPRADGHLVGSDGLRYFATLRSLVFDRDVDMTNDYRLLGVTIEDRTPRGLPANPFPVGPALLWLPFYLVACALAKGLASVGVPIVLDGVGFVYEAPVCLASAFAAGVAFLVLRPVLTRRGPVPRTDATLACLALAWATPAVYYAVAEPSMSHALSLFSNALFLRAWLERENAFDAGRMVRVGAAAALCALVRWQDAVVLAAPVVELGAGVIEKRLPALSAARASGVLLGTFALGMLPQLVFWRALYGSWLVLPQGAGFFAGGAHVIETLVSLRHGLLMWHPVLVLPLVGLFAAPADRRRLAFSIALVFALTLWTNASVAHWWADDAFGGRRFVGVLPWLAFPAAWALGWLRARVPSGLVTGCLLALVAWNGLLFIQYRAGWISRDAAPTWKQFTVDRWLLRRPRS